MIWNIGDLATLTSWASDNFPFTKSADDGGGSSYRRRQRFHDDLGIPFEKLASDTEHVEVDVAHGQLLVEVAKRHAETPEGTRLMLEGARETWEIERVWKGQLADMIEEVPGPS